MESIETFICIAILFGFNLYLLKYKNVVLTGAFLLLFSSLCFTSAFNPALDYEVNIGALIIGFCEIYMNSVSIFNSKHTEAKK